MANTILTHAMVARMAAKILMEESPFIAKVNRGRQEEFGEAVNGYKKGDTVKIELPETSGVYDGATFAGGGSAPDTTQTYVNLVMDTQKHTAMQFGAKERLLNITDFSENILRPKMRSLSSVIEADLITKAVQATANFVGTVGTIPTTMKTYAQARARLEQNLAPPGDRCMLYSSDANTELVDASKQLFHSGSQIERAFLRGSLGEAQGADFYEHQSIPVHTQGTQAVSSLVVNGATAEGATQIVVDGGTGTNTIKKGSVFTLQNVFAVHPLTGTAYSYLQPIVVTADVTLSGGAGTIPIWPPLRASMPNKTVSALPADNATIASLSGGASAAARQNLMFHKDAFTIAFAPLKTLAGSEGYTARLPNGMSVRVMTYGNGDADTERTRIDVLYGFTGVRQGWACRVTE